MDGGSHTPDIYINAKFVVKNLLDVISIEDIMDPEKFCMYFTDKQMKKNAVREVQVLISDIFQTLHFTCGRSAGSKES